jgi:hypothetical protein
MCLAGIRRLCDRLESLEEHTCSGEGDALPDDVVQEIKKVAAAAAVAGLLVVVGVGVVVVVVVVAAAISRAPLTACGRGAGGSQARWRAAPRRL